MNSGDEKLSVITGLDATVLLYHLHRFAIKHGHSDADRTLNEVTRLLSFSHRCLTSVVESALYCCNLLDEETEFWHPEGATFDEFARKVGKGRKFNKRYNYFEDRKS
jgi:hypothetical protein